MNARPGDPLAPAVALFLAAVLASGCTMLERKGRERELVGRFQENAQRWYDAGELQRAEYMAGRALELDPDDFKSNLLMGYVALRTPGRDRNELALTSFDRARKIRDDYRVSLGMALSHQREATRLRALGGPDEDVLARNVDEHLQKAEAYFRLTLRRIPDYPRALAGLGQVLALQGRYAEAVDELQKTVQFAETSQEGFRKLQERVATVEENRLLEERLEGAMVQEVEIRGLIANLLFKQGRYEEAVTHLDRMLSLDPARSVEYLNRARCHLELGDAEAARADAESFLAKSRLDLDSPLVREALRIRAEAESSAGGTTGALAETGSSASSEVR